MDTSFLFMKNSCRKNILIFFSLYFNLKFVFQLTSDGFWYLMIFICMIYLFAKMKFFLAQTDTEFRQIEIKDEISGIFTVFSFIKTVFHADIFPLSQTSKIKLIYRVIDLSACHLVKSTNLLMKILMYNVKTI